MVSTRKNKITTPTLPEYLLSMRLDGYEGQLSLNYIKKALSTARQFFTWLTNNCTGYKSIQKSWIDTLIPRHRTTSPNKKEAVTLDEVLAIASAPVKTTVERRIRAAAVF